MILDIDDLIEDGLDPGRMSIAAEQAMQGLAGCKSKEAVYLMSALESLRDECDLHDVT